jgi:hypothetical protein
MSADTQAWERMRFLHSCDAGALRGIPRSDFTATAIHTDRLPTACATQLRTGLSDWEARRTRPETPVYVVTSDRLPIAWLTARADIRTPQVPLSPVQIRHQRLAVEALTSLSRHALRVLADARDKADSARHAADGERSDHTLGAVRVAASNDPTDTVWVWPTGDADQTQREIRDALPHAAGRLVVISARGYGRYGDNAPIIDLDVVCTIVRITDTHRVTPTAVGNWIAAEAGRSTHLDPVQVTDAFAASFDGVFDSRTAWHRVIRQGWMEVFTNADIDPGFFHTDAYQKHLFDNELLDVDSGDGRIAVFSRATQPSASRRTP